MSKNVQAIVLAAGQGTRMKSSLPKVLHPVAGRPMVHHVVRVAIEAGASRVVVVVGHGREHVERSLREAFGDQVAFAHQETQRGTGHAALVGLLEITPEAEEILLLYGDTPQLQTADLVKLGESMSSSGCGLSMLTCRVTDPTGYGRILRDSEGNVRSVREHRDCSDEERRINEINPGVYRARAALLRAALPTLRSDNAQGEFYLTDIVEIAAKSAGVDTILADASTLEGINDRAQLHRAEEAMFARIADRWRRAGVTVLSGGEHRRCFQEISTDALVEQGVVLRGKTKVGERARIGVGSVLTDVLVGDDVEVKPYSVMSSSTVGDRAHIGPFSHLRPGSELHEDVHVGNFVETKATTMRKGAKANHLAYLGDGDVGSGSNIGAGTIFCNYDGFAKHKTVIGTGVFIGSDSQLVAPLTIGDGAYVATGTTVTRDVPADALAIGRIKQENKEGYASRLRNRLKAAAGK
ncbi:MAG: bifunctional UDP-N-acetylglucosamine diphosphorylase/glucosamine-1-phosphate N-acetyltransferase GlmU [Polyangiaceae bacterium]